MIFLMMWFFKNNFNNILYNINSKVIAYMTANIVIIYCFTILARNINLIKHFIVKHCSFMFICNEMRYLTIDKCRRIFKRIRSKTLYLSVWTNIISNNKKNNKNCSSISINKIIRLWLIIISFYICDIINFKIIVYMSAYILIIYCCTSNIIDRILSRNISIY